MSQKQREFLLPSEVKPESTQSALKPAVFSRLRLIASWFYTALVLAIVFFVLLPSVPENLRTTFSAASPRTLISEDGQVAIPLPEKWIEHDRSTNSLLVAMKQGGDPSLIVFGEPKTGLPRISREEYLLQVISGFQRVGTLSASEPKSVLKAALPAVQSELFGDFGGGKGEIFCLITVFESPTHFYQLRVVASAPSYGTNKADVAAIVKGFRQVASDHSTN